MSYAHGRNTAKAQLGLEKLAYNARTTKRIMDALKRMGADETTRAFPVRAPGSVDPIMHKELTIPGTDLAHIRLTRDRLSKLFGKEVSEVDFNGLSGLERQLRVHRPLMDRNVLTRGETALLRRSALPQSATEDDVRGFLSGLPPKQLRQALRQTSPEAQALLEQAKAEMRRLEKNIKKMPRKRRPLMQQFIDSIREGVLPGYERYLEKVPRTSKKSIAEALANDPRKLLRRYAGRADASQFQAIPQALLGRSEITSADDLLNNARNGMQESRDKLMMRDLASYMGKDVRRRLRKHYKQPLELLPEDGRMLLPASAGVRNGITASKTPVDPALTGGARANALLKGIRGYNPTGPSAEDLDARILSGSHVADKSIRQLPRPGLEKHTRKALERIPGFNPEETLWRGSPAGRGGDLLFPPGTAIWGSGIPNVSSGYIKGVVNSVDATAPSLTAYEVKDFTNPKVRLTPHVSDDTRSWTDAQIEKARKKPRKHGTNEEGDSPYYEAVVDSSDLAKAYPKATYRRLNTGVYHTQGQDLLKMPPLREPKKKK